MSTLFIIGNGFDIAHGLKTSYWYFMEYLEKYAEDFYTEFVSLYGYPPYGPDRFNSKKDEREYYKRRRESEYEALWKDLEHTLGIADEQNMLDFSASTVESLDLESGPVGIEDTLNYYWEEQYGFMTQLNDYLYRWARQIRLFKATPQSDRLLNNTNDCFMTFNYTNTLERIYHIPNVNVLHIHGGLPPVCYTKPIIGHGNKAVIDKYRQEAHKADEEFDEETFYETEKRLDLINHLKSKYGNTIADIIKYGEEKEERINVLNDYDAYLAGLQKNVSEKEKQLEQLSKKVSDIRKKESKKLTESIKNALLDLNFLDVQFTMEFAETDYTANGIDDAQFLISTNPGEPVKPLGKVASGGEISRIMLATS